MLSALRFCFSLILSSPSLRPTIYVWPTTRHKTSPYAIDTCLRRKIDTNKCVAAHSIDICLSVLSKHRSYRWIGGERWVLDYIGRIDRAVCLASLLMSHCKILSNGEQLWHRSMSWSMLQLCMLDVRLCVVWCDGSCWHDVAPSSLSSLRFCQYQTVR